LAPVNPTIGDTGLMLRKVRKTIKILILGFIGNQALG